MHNNVNVKHSLQTSQLSQFHRETQFPSWSHYQVLISHCEPSTLTMTHDIQPHSPKMTFYER